MMNRMIVGNLVHRPVRSLISIVAVALEVTLILLIVGLSLGMLQDQPHADRGHRGGCDRAAAGIVFYCRADGQPDADQGGRRSGQTAARGTVSPR